MGRDALRTRAETNDLVLFSPHALSSLVSSFSTHRPQFSKNSFSLLDYFYLSRWRYRQAWCCEESVKIQDESVNFCSTLCGGNQSERRWEIQLPWSDIAEYEILGVVRMLEVTTKAEWYLYRICFAQKRFWTDNIDDSFIIETVGHNGQVKA